MFLLLVTWRSELLCLYDPVTCWSWFYTMLCTVSMAQQFSETFHVQN